MPYPTLSDIRDTPAKRWTAHRGCGAIMVATLVMLVAACAADESPPIETPVTNDGTLGPNHAGGEICDNGIDDDGNGSSDEGCSCTLGQQMDCFPAPADKRAVGTCRDGVQICEGDEFGTWSTCQGAVLPQPDICGDMLDNDCDGEVDESCAEQDDIPTLTARWRYDVGAAITSSPAVAPDGTIYIGADDGNLYALNPDGTKKWHFAVGRGFANGGGWIASSPAIADDGTVYVGSYSSSSEAQLRAIHPDGTEKWGFATNTFPVESSPAIAADGTVYVQSMGHILYAVKNDGTERWRFEVGMHIRSSPAIAADGTIYLVNFGHGVFAINPNGTEKWRFGPAVESYDSSPAIGSDGTIYAVHTSDGLHAIWPDGRERWRFAFTSFRKSTSLALASDGTIYANAKNHIYAINPDGSEKWRFAETSIERSSPTVAADGSVYIQIEGRHLLAINPDGRAKGRFATGQRPGRPIHSTFCSSPTIAPDGTVYFGATDGHVYAIAGTSPLADSPWPKFRGNLRNTGRQ